MNRTRASRVKEGYERRLAIQAPRERVLESLTTLKGLRGWWTPLVRGNPSVGGKLRFDFEGMDEHIVMHVEAPRAPSSVVWICKRHTSLTEWKGTSISFEVAARARDSSELTFRHVGLLPDFDCYDACEAGWDHFLGSLASFAERGEGEPFRA